MIARILFDGLWQGALVAAVALAVVRAVPSRDATTRYAIWFAALLALVAVPILAALSNTGALLLAAARPQITDGRWTLSLIPVTSLAHGTASLVPAVLPWIGAAWIAGVAACLIRLGASLMRIRQIRANATPLAHGGVLVSNDIAVPIAVGLFRPAIVVPKRLVETLAPADLERILAHERAHVRRRDVAGNLVQRLIEALLFFNPWVYLIGRNLTLEREAACDDWAIADTGASDAYAACLASFARTLRRAPLAAPSAMGSRHALLARIERLARSASRPIALNRYAIGGTIVLFAILTLALEAFSPALAFAPVQSVGSTSGNYANTVAACAHSNVDATVTSPAQPQLPHGANLKGSATATVTIAPNGSVAAASITKSSGNPQIDKAVLDAAKHSTYSPKLVNCKPMQGSYLFHADFAPSPSP